MTLVVAASFVATRSVMDVSLLACLSLLGASALLYRFTTRRFGWGPSDT
jgi:hypothetical protein